MGWEREEEGEHKGEEGGEKGGKGGGIGVWRGETMNHMNCMNAGREQRELCGCKGRRG